MRCHFFIQSEVNAKPIMTHLHMFFCTLSQLHVFCSSFELLTEFSVSFVIGLSDYFGFGLYDTRFKTSHTCTFEC